MEHSDEIDELAVEVSGDDDGCLEFEERGLTHEDFAGLEAEGGDELLVDVELDGFVLAEEMLFAVSTGDGSADRVHALGDEEVELLVTDAV